MEELGLDIGDLFLRQCEVLCANLILVFHFVVFYFSPLFLFFFYLLLGLCFALFERYFLTCLLLELLLEDFCEILAEKRLVSTLCGSFPGFALCNYSVHSIWHFTEMKASQNLANRPRYYLFFLQLWFSVGTHRPCPQARALEPVQQPL